jgi:predicted acyltransferase
MPGRLHEGIFDPDGLLCKLTGLVTAMLGTFAGELLRRTDLSGNRKTLILLGAGVVSLLVCLVWMPWCPVNKKIWTPTFVLAAGSYSFIALAVFYWIIDVRGWRRWSFFFQVIGMNAITIYVIRRVVPLRPIGEFFLKGVASRGDAAWSSLVLSMGEVAVGWLILWFLYRKKVFLKV